MDPNRNSFGGLPPNRNGNGQGHPQQIPGFSYQLQNPQLSNLAGMQRGLNMQGLMQQPFDHRQRSYSDHRDFISSLTRQQNQGIQHHQGINLNQQQDHMYLANEYRRMQQAAQHQHNVHGIRHQQSPLAFLQEQHEMQKQRELQEEQTRQFREFLFSKQQHQVKSEPNPAPNGSSAQNIELQGHASMLQASDLTAMQLENRKRSLSNISSTKGHEEELEILENVRKTKIEEIDMAPSDTNFGEAAVEMKSTQDPEVGVGVDFQGTSNFTESNNQKEEDDKDNDVNDRTAYQHSDGEEEATQINNSMEEEEQNGIDLDDVDTTDDHVAFKNPEKKQNISDEYSSNDVIVINDESESNIFEDAMDNQNVEERNTEAEDADDVIEDSNPNFSLLLQVAEDSTMKPASDGMHILAQVTANRGTVHNQTNPPFFTDDEAAKMFTTIKDTLANDPTADKYFEEGITVFKRNLEESTVLAKLPKLPSEPEYDSSIEVARHSGDAQPRPEDIPLDVTEPVFLSNPSEDTGGEPLYYCAIDNWYPSNNAMKREKKRFKGDNTIASNIKLPSGEKYGMTASMQDRLSKSAEPGAVEKLPHCKIHARMFQAQYGKLSKEPLFCCQVTEIYCNSVMLCCSVCSSWRHAECGGHHTFYSPKDRTAEFVPICDICYKEKAILDKFPQCEKRMSRQRNIHLRKTLAAADIMRHAAYAKHGGTYKWPLGSVLPIHMGGHSRSVHIRHERAEKQWKEMLNRLNGGTSGKTKERVKQRTKELERVLNNLEEAEGKTDRHNMILFLERDTSLAYPTGFENPQLNFFDPQEDLVRLACLNDRNKKRLASSSSSSEDRETDNDCDTDFLDTKSSDSESSVPNSTTEAAQLTTPDHSSPGIKGRKAKSGFGGNKKIKSPPLQKYCISPGCKHKPRFDSVFCSDACGVSTMEKDLLRSLTFANNMHPYNLRN